MVHAGFAHAKVLRKQGGLGPPPQKKIQGKHFGPKKKTMTRQWEQTFTRATLCYLMCSGQKGRPCTKNK